MSPSEGQEMEEKGVEGREEWAVCLGCFISRQVSGLLGFAGSSEGLPLGSHGHWLSPNLCSPSCTLSLANPLLLRSPFPSKCSSVMLWFRTSTHALSRTPRILLALGVLSRARGFERMT